MEEWRSTISSPRGSTASSPKTAKALTRIWSEQVSRLGSPRVSRAGFGVSPKRTLLISILYSHQPNFGFRPSALSLLCFCPVPFLNYYELRRLRLVVEHDSETKRWAAFFPELPGCASAGDTEDEAIQNAKEAVELWFAL